MPPSLRDLLTGAVPAILTLRITDVPVVEPYQLANLQEPTWTGYVPSPFSLAQQSGNDTGWGWFEGFGQFTVPAAVDPPAITALFVVAESQPTKYLLAVMDAAESDWRILKKGTNTFNVRFTVYLEAAS